MLCRVPHKSPGQNCIYALISSIKFSILCYKRYNRVIDSGEMMPYTKEEAHKEIQKLVEDFHAQEATLEKAPEAQIENNLKYLSAILSSKLINFWCVNYLADDMNHILS